MRSHLFLLLLIFSFQSAIAQTQITVRTISIKGNIKTQDDIILRELAFITNASYSSKKLTAKIKESKENLVNLKLFNFITISQETNNNFTDINIDVIEKWYLWPYPIFELSERNFNVWWNEFKESDYSDFSRLNYGVFFNWENFRGRNELLKLKIRKGFKEHYLFSYQIPYFNRKKTIGINTNLQLFRRKKTFYQTHNNKLVYYENKNEYTSKDYSVNFELLYRKGLHYKHKIKLSYFNTEIADSIALLNPNYLNNNNNASSGSYAQFAYQFTDEHRDYVIYPLHGHLLEIETSKYFERNSTVNHYELKARVEKYIELKKQFFLGSSFAIKLSPKEQQAYFAQEGLGFNDYVRGYEYYVVDGQQYWLSKTAIKYALVEKRNFEIPYVKMRQFKKSHYSIYLGVFSDMGYIYDPPNKTSNPLQSKLLWGNGISLDYVTYYDKLLRIEYSVNHLGEKGVFLHFSNPFGSNK